MDEKKTSRPNNWFEMEPCEGNATIGKGITDDRNQWRAMNSKKWENAMKFFRKRKKADFRRDLYLL